MMILFDRDTWREVAETIGRNKRRSVATAFGVFWGIFMLIILLSLSNGFRNGIDMATKSLAPSLLGIMSDDTSHPYDGLSSGRRWDLTESDLQMLKARIPEIEFTAGSYTIWGGGQKDIVYKGKGARGPLMGITPDYFRCNYVDLVAGRMLSPSDHAEVRKYALLGIDNAISLFSTAKDALGKQVKCNDTYYTVIGVIKPTSDMVNIGPSMKTALMVPYHTIQNTSTKRGVVGPVFLTFKPGVDRALAKKQIESLLKATHRISPKDKKAISMFDIEELLNVFTSINLGLNILVWIVGIGTLLTGMVGISNILLVTVRERTQEIGVRRALGAKPSNIIMQLLMESLSLTAIAGVLGIVLGVGTMALVAENFKTLSSMPFVDPTVDLGFVFFALLIIIVSGVLAGLLPALKAIEVKAIEAIREE